MRNFLSSIFMLILFSFSMSAVSFDVGNDKHFSDEKEDTQFEEFVFVNDFEVTEKRETDESEIQYNDNERLQKLFDEAETAIEPVFQKFKNRVDKQLQNIYNIHKTIIQKYSNKRKFNTKNKNRPASSKLVFYNYSPPDLDLKSFLLNIKNRN